MNINEICDLAHTFKESRNRLELGINKILANTEANTDQNQQRIFRQLRDNLTRIQGVLGDLDEVTTNLQSIQGTTRTLRVPVD